MGVYKKKRERREALTVEVLNIYLKLKKSLTASSQHHCLQNQYKLSAVDGAISLYRPCPLLTPAQAPLGRTYCGFFKQQTDSEENSTEGIAPVNYLTLFLFLNLCLFLWQ